MDPSSLPELSVNMVVAEDDAPPSIPTVGMSDDEVAATAFEYSTRAPSDWVVSGPLSSQGGGPGRRFATIKQAEAWCRGKYGDRVIRRIPEATHAGRMRWAYLIRGGGDVRSDTPEGALAG